MPSFDRPEHHRERARGHELERRLRGANPLGPDEARETHGERGYTGGFFAGPSATPRGYERRGRFAGRGPKGYRRSDERIREEICDLLTEDPEIDASEVTVTVENGEVTLEGCVADRQMKRDAEDCIESISGVRQVHNRLRNEPMGGFEQGRAAAAERMGAYSETGASEGQRTAGERRTTH